MKQYGMTPWQYHSKGKLQRRGHFEWRLGSGSIYTIGQGLQP